MAVTFNPETGIVVDDAVTVRKNVAQLWKEAFKTPDGKTPLNIDPETPAGQLIDGHTALILQKDNEIAYLANMFNPSVADGLFQDAIAKFYFLSRHVAEATLVTCTCKGLLNTTIPYGAIVQDTNGNKFYNTNVGIVGEGGTVDCVFRCAEYGPVKVAAHSVIKIVTVIPGWDSVNNEEAGITGRDRESQQEFETRRRESVAKNSHGLAESIEGTIGDLSGVVACRIEQNRSDETITMLGVQIPPHSVYLSVYGGDSKEIGEVMHKKIDAGCGTAGNTKVQLKDPTNGSPQTYYFEVPVVTPLGVRVRIQPDSSTPTTIVDDIKKAVQNNFNGDGKEYVRVKMGDTLYASRFYKAIIQAGATNLIKIEVAYPYSSGSPKWQDSISVPLNQIPALSDDNIVVVQEGA